MTSTKVLTRWKTTTTTQTARAARGRSDRRHIHLSSVVELGEQPEVAAEMMAPQHHRLLFARHLCPPCPAGRSASFNAPCCPKRQTKTRTIVRTRTKTIVVVTRKKTTSIMTSPVLNIPPFVTVNGIVFSDVNGNGVFDQNEPTLSGVGLLAGYPVVKKRAQQTTVANTTSGSDGSFTFTIARSLLQAGKELSIFLEQTGLLLLNVPLGSNGLPQPSGNSVPVPFSATSTTSMSTTKTNTITKTATQTRSQTTGTVTKPQ